MLRYNGAETEQHHQVCGSGRVPVPAGGRSEDIGAAYVSPVTYQSYNCKELSLEAQRVSSAAAAAAGAQDSQRTKDAVATTAAVLIFWPAAFLVGGDNAKMAELANLKGQMQAIEAASIQTKCGISFQRG